MFRELGEEKQRGGVEGLIRELKAAVGNGAVAISWTPAVSSLGRSPLVLSQLDSEERLSQGSWKNRTYITWMNSFVPLLYIECIITKRQLPSLKQLQISAAPQLAVKRGESCNSMRDPKQHHWSTTHCQSDVWLTTPEVQIQFLTLVIQRLWSTF